MAFLSEVHTLLPVGTVNSVATLKIHTGCRHRATNHELCHTLLIELKVVVTKEVRRKKETGDRIIFHKDQDVKHGALPSLAANVP